MITKRILLLFLLFLFNTIFSENVSFTIPIENWDIDETYTNKTFNLGIIKEQKKNILQKSLNLPDAEDDNIIYLYIKKHTGYSKIYLNNKLLTTIGTVYQIREKSSEFIHIVPISAINRNNLNTDTLKIINYSIKDSPETEYIIKSDQSIPWNLYIYSKLTKSLPLAYSIIVIFLLISYTHFKEAEEDIKNRYYHVTLILFLLFFIINGVDNGSVFKDKLQFLSYATSIAAWLSFMLYYVIKYSMWDTKKIIPVSLITTLAILSLSILQRFGILPSSDESIFRFILILINISFLYLLYKKPVPNMRSLILGLIYGLVLHIVNFILSTIYNYPDYQLSQTAIIIVLVGYYLTVFHSILSKIETNTGYSDKLFDSMEKGKLEILKKETQISELKNVNEDILREKSLFFTTLGRNLRAPLNSIIGYSENLYTTDNLDEVTPLVTEIIVESDKIFQAINNIMDFSTREFTNNDLLLKDFRMKEIFENSVYASPLISAYKSQINYIALDDSDKVIIKGNPIIYKQIVTNIMQFLIGLSPESIDYTIFNSGITDTYMDLEARFSANKLKDSNLSLVTPFTSEKDVFTKYIKLYNISFYEECSDSNYNIEIKFQCGLSNSNSSILSNGLNIPRNHDLDKNISVLVVEDYLPNLNIVKMHLTKMGCNVLTATNGEDAIIIFKNEIVDVILMDIKMPIMDGWTATEAIRSTEKGLDTLIIGLTASSLDLDIRHCFESGMDDVQVKPIRKNQLYSKLKSLETFKPEIFPSLSSLRADYGISKLETETLFISTINQISKQLEVLDILVCAADDAGVQKEILALIHASLLINAFYFSRILRNFQTSYFNSDSERVKLLQIRLVEIINIVKEKNEELFRN